MKRKNTFTLETVDGNAGNGKFVDSGRIEVVGQEPEDKPYLVIEVPGRTPHFVKDKDLKLFVKNLSKALKLID